MRDDTYWERYESIVEQRIREAAEDGAFDDLPGAGKPLRGLHGPQDDNWWLRSYLEREGLPKDVLLPTPLRLRREIDRLPETVRDLETEREVRDIVAALARRVAEWLRFPDGPRVSVRMPRADEIVEGWRAERAARTPPAPSDTAPVTPDPSRWAWFRRALRRGR